MNPTSPILYSEKLYIVYNKEMLQKNWHKNLSNINTSHKNKLTSNFYTLSSILFTMFQSTDDLNLDDEFLNDILEIPQSILNNDQNKRLSVESIEQEQPMKKFCTNSRENETTKHILSIIKSKSQPTPLNNIHAKQIPGSLDNRKVVQRKFPGPAGILPEQKQINTTSALEEIDTSPNKKLEPDVILCSQFTENNFKKGPWQQMLSDWVNNKEKINLPYKYTITWTKCKATAKKLIGQKTPFLAAVIQSIDPTNKNPMILLKDKTDEIQATLLHEVWDEYYEFLIPGSVIVLKQVGVLSTLKKQYLAITSNNLITIYSEHECEESGNIENRITKVQQFTVSDVIKIIEEIKRSNESRRKISVDQPIVNNPYFKTNPNKFEDTLLTKLNNSLQNKTLQIISDIRSATGDIKKCTNNTFQPASPILIRNGQNVNTLETCSSTPQKTKFKFKSKIDHSHTCNEPNKENNQSHTTINFAPGQVLNENEDDILTQVLDGVDTASIFEDF